VGDKSVPLILVGGIIETCVEGSSSVTIQINPLQCCRHIQCRGSTTLVRSLSPSTTMNRFFSNKRKKSPEPSPQGILPTIPTDTATEPVRYQVQSNIGPEGGQTRSDQGPEVDLHDLTVVLDDRTSGGSRIVFKDRMDEDQELPASVASTSGVVIGGTERRNNRTSASDSCDWD